jgi:hypothetical protein
MSVAYEETLRRIVEYNAPSATVVAASDPMSLDIRITIYPAPKLCPRLFVSEVFNAARLARMDQTQEFVAGLLNKLSNANYFEAE